MYKTFKKLKEEKKSKNKKADKDVVIKTEPEDTTVLPIVDEAEIEHISKLIKPAKRAASPHHKHEYIPELERDSDDFDLANA